MKIKKLEMLKEHMINNIKKIEQIIKEKEDKRDIDIEIAGDYAKGYLDSQTTSYNSQINMLKNYINILELIEKDKLVKITELNQNIRILDSDEFKIEMY